jgi:hypothetical protein
MHLRTELTLTDGFKAISAEVFPEFCQFHPRLCGEIVRNHHHAHHQVIQENIEYYSVILLEVYPDLIVLAVFAGED